jgi:hypothetical protein
MFRKHMLPPSAVIEISMAKPSHAMVDCQYVLVPSITWDSSPDFRFRKDRNYFAVWGRPLSRGDRLSGVKSCSDIHFKYNFNLRKR